MRANSVANESLAAADGGNLGDAGHLHRVAFGHAFRMGGVNGGGIFSFRQDKINVTASVMANQMRNKSTGNTGLLNFADLSRGISIPQTTLKRYFTLLQASFLMVTIPAWTNNRGLRQTKASKIFISDTGLACHLLGADSNTIRTDGRIRGMLMENFVAMELLKQIGWSKSPH